MSMEIVQLCKSTYNNQLQQSIYLCHKRNMSQIWQVNTLWQSQGETSHHDAHLHSLTNVPTKCQPSTPYRIQESGQDFKLMVNMTRSKSNQDHTMMFHTYNPKSLSLPSINLLHITVSEI